MNERIKELALQAGWSAFEALDERNEKFAQLIVEECIRRTVGCHLAHGYVIAGDFSLGYKKGVDKVAEQIKKHFGMV